MQRASDTPASDLLRTTGSAADFAVDRADGTALSSKYEALPNHRVVGSPRKGRRSRSCVQSPGPQTAGALLRRPA